MLVRGMNSVRQTLWTFSLPKPADETIVFTNVSPGATEYERGIPYGYRRRQIAAAMTCYASRWWWALAGNSPIEITIRDDGAQIDGR